MQQTHENNNQKINNKSIKRSIKQNKTEFLHTTRGRLIPDDISQHVAVLKNMAATKFTPKRFYKLRNVEIDLRVLLEKQSEISEFEKFYIW